MRGDDSVFAARRVRAWQHDVSGRTSSAWTACTGIMWPAVLLRPVCLPVLAAECRARAEAASAPRRAAARSHRGCAGDRWPGVPGRRCTWSRRALSRPALRTCPGRDLDDRLQERGAVRTGPAAVASRPAPRKGPGWHLAELAAAASWTPAAVRIYGRDTAEDLAEITCLWYGCLDVRTVGSSCPRRGHHAALVTTDWRPRRRLVERYAARGNRAGLRDAATSWAPRGPHRPAARPAHRPVRFARAHPSHHLVRRHGHDPPASQHRCAAEPWYSGSKSALERPGSGVSWRSRWPGAPAP